MSYPLSTPRTEFQPFARVTWGLIILNVLIFTTWVLPQGFEELQYNLFKYGVVPAEYYVAQDLPPYLPFPYWGSLITMLFIHAGSTHLLGNMVFLWLFGQNVERAFGPYRFLLFYLLSGLAATVFHIMLNPQSVVPSVGASGAISGVLAAYVLLFPSHKIAFSNHDTVRTISAMGIIGFWVVLQFINAMSAVAQGSDESSIAYMAHLGGFLAGIPLAYILSWFTPQRVNTTY